MLCHHASVDWCDIKHGHSAMCMHVCVCVWMRRGRVMNRTARISEKAGSGQVWCSEAAWQAAQKTDMGELKEYSLEATSLGSFNLKVWSQHNFSLFPFIFVCMPPHRLVLQPKHIICRKRGAE